MRHLLITALDHNVTYDRLCDVMQLICFLSLSYIIFLSVSLKHLPPPFASHSPAYSHFTLFAVFTALPMCLLYSLLHSFCKIHFNSFLRTLNKKSMNK